VAHELGTYRTDLGDKSRLSSTIQTEISEEDTSIGFSAEAGTRLPGGARMIGPPNGTRIWLAAGVTDTLASWEYWRRGSKAPSVRQPIEIATCCDRLLEQRKLFSPSMRNGQLPIKPYFVVMKKPTKASIFRSLEIQARAVWMLLDICGARPPVLGLKFGAYCRNFSHRYI
jgi:hypothetical protein